MKKTFLFLFMTIISNLAMTQNLERITLGGGCFWCTEAVYLELKGVEKVEPGYSGGHVKNPTYKEVCSETTGHAEVVQITYNPNEVDFTDILEVFFATHDPTTLNRQGNDVGTQYRSAIFYETEKQKQTALEIIKKLNNENVFGKPIVTEVTAFTNFYRAEDYHINYFARNKNQGYCQFIIAPKMEKFRKVFKNRLK